MRNSLETTMDLLKEVVDLRVEYDYHADDDISIQAVEILRHSRELAYHWACEQWVRVDLTEILSRHQVDTIKTKIIEHESTIRQWREEYACQTSAVLALRAN